MTKTTMGRTSDRWRSRPANMARFGAAAPLVVLLPRVSNASGSHLALECPLVLRLRRQSEEPSVTYIEIPRWDEFQHYGKRQPPWIKNYTRLLDDDSYLALTWAQRGLLHGIWLAYAKSNRQLTVTMSKRHPNIVQSMSNLTRQLGQRVDKRSFESLNHAGFVLLPASNVLADCLQPASAETEEETEKNTEGSYAGTPGELERLGAVYDFQAVLREQRGRGAA